MKRKVSGTAVSMAAFVLAAFTGVQSAAAIELGAGLTRDRGPAPTFHLPLGPLTPAPVAGNVAPANDLDLVAMFALMRTDNSIGTAIDRARSTHYGPSLELDYLHRFTGTPYNVRVDLAAASDRHRSSSLGDRGDTSATIRAEYDMGMHMDDQKPVFYVSASQLGSHDRSFDHRDSLDREYAFGMDLAWVADANWNRLPPRWNAQDAGTWYVGVPFSITHTETASTALTFSPEINYAFRPSWEIDLTTNLQWERPIEAADGTRARVFAVNPVLTLGYTFDRPVLGANARAYFQVAYTQVESTAPYGDTHTWEFGPAIRFEW